MKIEGYSFGSIRIDGHNYHSDVIIYTDRVTSWWREEGHLLQIADVAPLLAEHPDILVVGTGYSGAMHVAPEVELRCAEQGVELLANRTTNACQLFNRLAEEGTKRLIAALHLTC